MKTSRNNPTSAGLVWICALVPVLAVSGCGNLTMGGVGEVGVGVSGDVQAAQPTTAAISSSWSASSIARSDHEDGPEGQLEIEFLLFLATADGTSLQLGEELEAQVDLKGESNAEVVDESVPADLYSELRIVFIKIEAQVDAGLVINGVPITGPVEVHLEDPLTVSRDVDIEVTDGSRVDLLIDLNSAQWLEGLDPENGTVDAEFFAGLLEVVVG